VPISSFGAPSGVISISAGGSHAMALKSGGTVWAWGFNGSGQVGDGTFNQQLLPVQVAAPVGAGFFTGASAIAAGSTFSLAVKSDGSVFAWGANNAGQLSYSPANPQTSNKPIPVLNLTGAQTIAAGDSHSIVLEGNGSVFAWGANNAGQLGR